MIKNPVVSPIVDPVQLVISSLESLIKFSSHVLQNAIINSMLINKNAILSLVVTIEGSLDELLLNRMETSPIYHFRKEVISNLHFVFRPFN